MRAELQSGVFVCAAALAVALGQAVPAWFGSTGLPQVPGEDVLALVLGDARQELSGALLEKVEEYYHGGVRHPECEEGLAAAAEEPAGHEDGRPHEGGHDEHHPESAQVPAAADPWQWINRRVHTQEDRHLERERAVELLPWLWAARRTSAKNVEAYQIGSFVLASMTRQPEEAARLLEDGIRENPKSAELEFSLGELCLGKLGDAARAEAHFAAARDKCLIVEGEAGGEARGLKVQALFYLGYLAKKRGDAERVAAFLKEAEATDAAHVATQNLRALAEKRE